MLLCFQAAPGPAGLFSASEVDISIPNTMDGKRWPPLKSFKVARTLPLSTAWAGHWSFHLPVTWETSQFRSEQVLNLSHLHPLEIQSVESSLWEQAANDGGGRGSSHFRITSLFEHSYKKWETWILSLSQTEEVWTAVPFSSELILPIKLEKFFILLTVRGRRAERE